MKANNQLLKQIKEKTEYTKNIDKEILNESVRIYLSVIETLVEAKEQEEEINKNTQNLISNIKQENNNIKGSVKSKKRTNKNQCNSC